MLEPKLKGLYRDLHEHPELAFHEERTAATLAANLRALGFEVTTGVGGTGLVAMLYNGTGPVVMLRTELIPDEVRMLMSVCSYDEKVRKHFLASIKRQLDAEAEAADAPSPPLIKVISGAEAVYNDPQVTSRLVDVMRRDLGPESVVEMSVKMTSEDFSEYGRAGVRAVLLHIGAVNPKVLGSGAKLPDLHSPQWFPELEPTLRSLVAAEVVMLTELLAPAGIVGE